MSNSEIIHHAGGGTTLVGPDAVNLFRAITLVSAMRLYAKSGLRVSRNVTPTVMMKIAHEYTGKTFKGANKWTEAADAVQVWVDTMKAALPVTTDGVQS